MSVAPIRVLQVVSSSATSGAEKHVVSLSRQLVARGHYVEAICPTEGWVPSMLRETGIPVHISNMRGAGWYRTLGLMLHLSRKRRLDLIHTHLTRAAYLGCSASILGSRPVVTSVHIANNDPVYRRLARGSNRLVAVSSFVRGMLYGRGVPRRYIDIVHNGTDFADFAPSNPEGVLDEFKIPRDRPVIGVVGRVCPEKGQLEMLDVMTRLAKERRAAHLMVVGAVGQGFETPFAEAVSRAGLGDRVTVTGLRHDIPRLLDAMTLTAMPSHMETFGVAAIEAMARRKAVVATCVGGLPEVVRHRQTGLLVDLRPEAIAEAIGYLLDHEAERRAMGEAGRRLVEERFTLGDMVRRLEGVYARALGRDDAIPLMDHDPEDDRQIHQ